MASPGKTSTILYTHRFSPYAERAQIAMIEKGIPFEPIMVDLSNKPKGLLEVNPLYGKVPSLSHNGNSVVESLIILEYLEEAFPDTVPLLPKDALGKAKCRFWADYIYKGITDLHQGMSAAPGSPEKEASTEKNTKFFKTLNGAMNEFCQDGPFFCGEKFGYLDVILAPLTCWVLVLEKMGHITIPDDLPRLRKWMKTTAEHKSVKEVLPSNEEVQVFLAEMGEKKAAAARAAHAK